MDFKRDVYIKNRKALYDYHVLEEYVAGIVLVGTEVKSIRQGKASLVDTFCTVDGGELFVRNMNVAEYEQGTYLNHNPTRMRKLLMRRREIDRVAKALKDTGVTCVPLALFISDRGLVKVKVAVVRGKKMYDKREAIKRRDRERDMRASGL